MSPVNVFDPNITELKAKYAKKNESALRDVRKNESASRDVRKAVWSIQQKLIKR